MTLEVPSWAAETAQRVLGHRLDATISHPT